MVDWLLKYWLGVLFSGMTGVLVSVIIRMNATRAGVQALLRDRLIQSYNHFMEQGFCAIHERDNFINMYNQYHKLGVNGVMDCLVEDVMDLPTIDIGGKYSENRK